MNIQDTIDKILNDLPKRATKRDIEITRVKISLLFEEKVVLQKRKWRELLKLLQTQPYLEGKSTLSKFIEYHGENEEWRMKIEKKLEELNK